MEERLTGSPKMFSTLGGTGIHQVTRDLADTDPALSKILNTHGARKFWAAVKAQGLEPEDVDKVARKNEIKINAAVPESSKAQITQHRSKMWEDLRQSRLRDVEICLENMKDEDVRRYWACSKGINPVGTKDIPAVDQLGGMGDFNEQMDRETAKAKAEQSRKATGLGLEFLLEKKKREEAEAKVAAFEKRIAEYKKEQIKGWKEKAAESVKKAEKRTADAERAAQQRREWEDETEVALWDRFGGARARREHRYSPEGLAGKLAANKAKRVAAFEQAAQQEHDMLERLEEKRLQCEERLEVRRQDVEERMEQQRNDSQAKFQQRQVMIHAKTTEWVEQKLASHKNHQDHLDHSRSEYRKSLKEKSKSTGDIRKKAFEKVKQGKDKLKTQNDERDQAIALKYQQADVRREALNAMALKNENDIHTFREIKHGTFGELTRRRNEENRSRRDATSQRLVIDLAERQAKGLSKTDSAVTLLNSRQQISKDMLCLKDRATLGFLKIQSEPNEAKVIAEMNAMGFDMPTLPEPEDDEGGAEEKPKAF